MWCTEIRAFAPHLFPCEKIRHSYLKQQKKLVEINAHIMRAHNFSAIAQKQKREKNHRAVYVVIYVRAAASLAGPPKLLFIHIYRYSVVKLGNWHLDGRWGNYQFFFFWFLAFRISLRNKSFLARSTDDFGQEVNDPISPPKYVDDVKFTIYIQI